MTNDVLACADAIRCAETKIEECLAERDGLEDRLKAIKAAISYQEEVKRVYEQRIAVLNEIDASESQAA